MVLKFLNDDEALRIASNLEREGYRFYTEAARRATNPQTKKFFMDLAGAEKGHLEHFEELRAQLPKRGSEPWGDEEEIVNTYLRMLIDTGVFSRPGKKETASRKDLSDLEALKIGIQTEKDSILFFTEAARLCKNPKGKRMFRTLVGEEKQHLTDLAQYLKGLRRSST